MDEPNLDTCPKNWMMLRRQVLAACLLLAAPAWAEVPLRIGSTAGPCAKTRNFVAKRAHMEGLEVKVVEFNDFTLPNEALSHGNLYASNFQNLSYLEDAVATRCHDIVPRVDPKSALVEDNQDTRYGLWFTTRAKLIAIDRSPEVKQLIFDRFGRTIMPTW